MLDVVLEYGVIFLVGIGAGAINVLAGGGSTIILPLLILYGLSPHDANGTNRVAIAIQSFSALVTFRRHKIFNAKKLAFLGILVLPGTIAGAYVASKIPAEWFVIALLIVIGAVVLLLFYPVRSEEVHDGKDFALPWYVVLLLIGVGFYGGFIQAGAGILIIFILHRLQKCDLFWTNMYKVGIVFMMNVPALLIFAWQGQVRWAVGAVLALGNTIGSIFALRLSLRRGEVVIRYILGIALLIMLVRLMQNIEF